ncbi:TonB-dependent receptor domain-containing protein [Mesoterricola silvestris]|uniref:TonB-dependent receptor-like beta-barrel domain-containing protein n=1 Tax=Mesoterricola silvestris TaxID=2927979 RepID=A0AA48GKK5_9BACT|nr:TonB-dependent receptor [Mesoterricola silvestris]BDU71474.1 hypothetical protein METEAL_06480 [Mesoterricola silvestris]
MARPWLLGGVIYATFIGQGLLGAEGRRPSQAGSESSQFFARGFELEFGNDFEVDLGGLPLNTPSHVRGPGYLDTALVIPEVVEGFQYARGLYRSTQTAVAGKASMELVAAQREPFFSVTYGGARTDRFARFLWTETLPSRLTYALDITRTERPWDDLLGSARMNAAFRKDGEGRHGPWTFTLLGSDDRTDGGGASPARPWTGGGGPDDARVGDGTWNRRVLLGWRLTTRSGPGSSGQVRVYAGGHHQRIWNNWTYFLRDPVKGDQLEQVDRRAFAGLDSERTRDHGPWTFLAGLQLRADRVTAEVNPTLDRKPVDASPTPRQTATGGLYHGTAHGQATLRMGHGWESFLALRLDLQTNRIRTSTGPWTPQDRSMALGSPRAGISFSPSEGTVFSASAGRGFRVGDAFRDTQPMVRTTSVEVSAQTRPLPPWVASLTLWRLDLETEVLFDPGQNAFTSRGPAHHEGLELYNEVKRGPWRGELAWGWNRAAFKAPAHGLDQVPGAVPLTGYLGLGWKDRGFALEAKVRRTGVRPLTPDGAARASRQDALELRAEVALDRWTFGVEVINAFSLKKFNYEYQYASRFPDGPVVQDLHRKAADPQAIRVEIRRRF